MGRSIKQTEKKINKREARKAPVIPTGEEYEVESVLDRR